MSSEARDDAQSRSRTAPGKMVLQQQAPGKHSHYSPDPSKLQQPMSKPRAMTQPTQRQILSNNRVNKVVAVYNYNARCYDELTFKRGDLFI